MNMVYVSGGQIFNSIVSEKEYVHSQVCLCITTNVLLLTISTS